MSNKKIINLNQIQKVRDFVNDVMKIDADIDIVSGRYVIDAKSIMGIFSLDLSKNIEVLINTEDQAELDKFNEAMEKYKA